MCVLAIKDDGAGFPPHAGRKTGMGLQNMKARARMIGASLEIRAGESGGAEVTCLLRNPKPQAGSGQEAYAHVRQHDPLRERKGRLLLVEDHPVTREGLAQLLNQQPDLQVCGQAGTAPEALTAADALKPDLVLVDISLGGTSGIELIKDLASRHATLPILVLSTHDELLYAERSLRAGARGYVMKHEPTERVMAAIRQVLRGGVYLSEQMQSRLVRDDGPRAGPVAPASDMEPLSDRELEVFT